MLEILAPAGNAECAKAAIESGANALYLGFSAFSARMNADNFGLEELVKTVKDARFGGVSVYVAMNTVVKDDELEKFFETFSLVWSAGVDAVILQDVFLGKLIKEKFPKAVLHLSTQAGVCNAEGAETAKRTGFSRVILARETPIEEIKKISKIIETEVFVQGALCSSFSGQCYLSSFAGGNSGNRGRCKQPCRKLYAYDRNGYEEKAYALSPSDLCVGEGISKLIEAGVSSFKIEGRMRRAEYVAAAVSYYRALLDGATEKEKTDGLSDLKRTFNRGNYTKGLAFGQDKRFMSRSVQGHIGEKVGVVKVENGKYAVESSFKAKNGDCFKILRQGKEVGGATFAKSELRGFLISSKARLKNGDGVFVTTDTALNQRLLGNKRNKSISVKLTFQEGERAIAEGLGVKAVSHEALESATTRALTEAELKECFLKTDGLAFDVSFEKIELKGNIFVAKSRLNAFRRAFYGEVEKRLTEREREALPTIYAEAFLPQGENKKVAVIADDFGGIAADIAIYKPNDYTLPLPESFKNGNFEKYIYYPAFLTSGDRAAIERLCEGADGIYAENYGGLSFAEKRGLKLFAGTGFNLTNALSVNELLSFGFVSYYVVSKELEKEKREGLLGEKAFVLTTGDLKVMDLIYCPFEKTCVSCDRRKFYTLTDENGRRFPVRRYISGDGACRFEVYNCANLVGASGRAGALVDLSVTENKKEVVSAISDMQVQKKLYEKYTLGHNKTNELL